MTKTKETKEQIINDAIPMWSESETPFKNGGRGYHFPYPHINYYNKSLKYTILKTSTI